VESKRNPERDLDASILVSVDGAADVYRKVNKLYRQLEFPFQHRLHHHHYHQPSEGEMWKMKNQRIEKTRISHFG